MWYARLEAKGSGDGDDDTAARRVACSSSCVRSSEFWRDRLVIKTSFSRTEFSRERLEHDVCGVLDWKSGLVIQKKKKKNTKVQCCLLSHTRADECRDLCSKRVSTSVVIVSSFT